MKITNPFDNMLERQKSTPSSLRDAAIELTDTLNLCWAAARQVFDKQAKPEHALALLPIFMQRSDAKRQQAEADYKTYTEAANAPAAAKKRQPRGPKAN